MSEYHCEFLSYGQALSTEASAIAALIESLSGPFFTSPDREGAEQFLVSICASAIESYLVSERYIYIVARRKHEVVGVAALRDNTHLFHLFVVEACQRRGVARKLWSVLRHTASERGGNGLFTVNSSLNAIPVYEAFGFSSTGVIVTTHGVSFQAMRYVTPAA